MAKDDIIINVDEGWQRDDTYEGIFPKGARDKSVYFSPKQPELDFIRSDHRYLFKRSNQRYPWQFWIEIIAYRIGRLMGVEVPPSYVGYSENEDPGERVYGSLIEWFYGPTEKYVDGGLLLKILIKDYDLKKGKQHNFESILIAPSLLNALFQSLIRQEIAKSNIPPEATFVIKKASKIEFASDWAIILTFDTIIGNVDRHHDNWGIITDPERITTVPKEGLCYEICCPTRLSPAFDNGTAMGYEVLEENFHKFNEESYLLRYLTRKSKARHHMKWSLEADEPMNFFDFMRKFVTEYPGTKLNILSHLNITRPQVENELRGLVDLVPDGKYHLTPERLDFTIKLLMKRIELFKETMA